MVDLAFFARLGKEAGEINKTTVQSKTVRMSTANKDDVAQALRPKLKPAAHVAPTRYGRKPYSRGMQRDSC